MPLSRWSFPCWSPDARYLACPLWRQKGQADAKDSFALLILTAGEHPVPLHQWNLCPNYLEWSPDSQSLASIASSQEEERTSIWVARIAESRPQRLAPSHQDGAEGTLAWSPDSQKIAFPSWTEEYARHFEFYQTHEHDPRYGSDRRFQEIYHRYVDCRQRYDLGQCEYAEYMAAYTQHTQAYGTFVKECGPSYEDTFALHILEVEAQNLRRTPMVDTDTIGDFHPHRPTWSPDSTQVAYNSPGHEYFHAVGANGASLRCLSDAYAAYLRGEEDLDENEDPEGPVLILSPKWQPA